MRYKSKPLNTGTLAEGPRASFQSPVNSGPEKYTRGPVADARANVASKSRRLHRKEAAHYLGVSLSWLDKARMTGRGPTYITIGARVVYDLADLDAYLRQNRHETGFGP